VENENAIAKRGVGRPSKAQPFRAMVVDLLLQQPGMRSLEIVRRARQEGYTGGKSALYALIASVRPRRSRPLGDHDKVPGEIARHGFGQVEVRCADGRERTFTVFVSRLEYSGWVAASLVPDQSVESCVRTLAAHYVAMGGVPLLAAFDRARPVGLRADAAGHVLEWDPAFAHAALQLGVGVEVRARRGADRGPGTNLGNWIKLAFFKHAVISDEADAAAQLHDWVRIHNNLPVNEASAKTPAILLAEERQRLRSMRLDPNDLALRFPVLVGPRAVVVHDNHAYAMAPEAVGLIGELQLYPSKVTIVAGRYEATHSRSTPYRPAEISAGPSVDAPVVIPVAEASPFQPGGTASPRRPSLREGMTPVGNGKPLPRTAIGA
jgi:hypothetical protein